MKKTLIFLILVTIIFFFLMTLPNDKEKPKKHFKDEVIKVDSYIIEYKNEIYESKNEKYTIKNKRNIIALHNQKKEEVAQKVEKHLNDYSNDYFYNMKLNSDTEINNIKESKTKELLIKTINNTNKYLSFTITESTNNKNEDIFGFTYELKVGTLLYIKNITDKDNELISIINKEVERQLKQKVVLKNDWQDILSNDYYNNFSMNKDFLTIYLHIDDISNKKGLYEIKIDKKIINDLLKEEYR